MDLSKINLTGVIPIDQRLVSGTLENGMKYYIQKNSKPENRAELRLVVDAGSILEDEDQLGIAHFVEHMAFNGTENFKKSELVDYLESVGTRFGPDLNAYTSFDETVYMLQVRSDSTELFDKGMLILKDWASGIAFEHQEIDKERGVVVSEWRTRLSAAQRMQQETLPMVYKGSRYAERLPIGDPEIIKTSDYSIFKRFYKDWYRPDLMAVVVVGDIDPSVVEKQIKENFGQIPASLNPRERKKYKVPTHPETLIAIASDEEASFTNVNVMNKLPQTKTKTMGDMRASILRSAYNGMFNERLAEIGKEADPPFVFAYTGYSGDVGDIDTYSSFAMVPEGKSIEALERLLLENKRVLEHGFTVSELERQKKNMMESAERRYKEMDKTNSAQLAMRYVYNYLDDNPIPSPSQMLKIYNKYLPGITVGEIN
jgi:zinc protease